MYFQSPALISSQTILPFPVLHSLKKSSSAATIGLSKSVNGIQYLSHLGSVIWNLVILIYMTLPYCMDSLF